MKNTTILQRFNSLITEGSDLWSNYQKSQDRGIDDPVRWAKWTTSSLNLLDKLSITTNRFVREFEIWVHPSNEHVNIGSALGVLKSALEEYEQGLAIEYHLSISASVFDGILDEADYLSGKGYWRASAVLIGAALEEGLKNRARAMSIPVSPKDTLYPMIQKLKDPQIGVFTAFDAKKLEGIAEMRNKAAHGEDFKYKKVEVGEALTFVRAMLDKLLRL